MQQDPAHPAVRAASEFMMYIAALYAEVKISRDQLTDTSNLLAKRGTPTPKRGGRVRQLQREAALSRSHRVVPRRSPTRALLVGELHETRL